MGKIFPSGTLEKELRNKAYPKDKRKRVRLVHLRDRPGNDWYYVFVGSDMKKRFPNLAPAKKYYDDIK